MLLKARLRGVENTAAAAGNQDVRSCWGWWDPGEVFNPTPAQSRPSPGCSGLHPAREWGLHPPKLQRPTLPGLWLRGWAVPVVKSFSLSPVWASCASAWAIPPILPPHTTVLPPVQGSCYQEQSEFGPLCMHRFLWPLLGLVLLEFRTIPMRSKHWMRGKLTCHKSLWTNVCFCPARLDRHFRGCWLELFRGAIPYGTH